MALKYATTLNFGFGGVEQSDLSLSYMFGMPNFRGFGSEFCKASEAGKANTKLQKIARKKNGRTNGLKGKSTKFPSSIYILFDRDYFLDLLKKVGKKEKYQKGISLEDMHGEYEMSKKGMKKKMFPFKTLREKFSTKTFEWIEENIKIVSKVYRGKTIIKMKKR